MQLSFQYGTRNIEFTVTYSNRKTIQITVEPPDIVKVTAPMDTPKDAILEKVKSKASWIVQKLFAFKDMEFMISSKEFVNGESFLYLGRNYSLNINLNGQLKRSEVKLYQGKFIVETPTKDEMAIRKAMEQWYRQKAEEKVNERVEYYQHYFKIKPKKVSIKEQKKRWGSCTGDNHLLFNWRIIMAPSPVLSCAI